MIIGLRLDPGAALVVQQVCLQTESRFDKPKEAVKWAKVVKGSGIRSD